MIPPNVALYFQLEVRDANGKLVRRTRKYRARSFVKQYIQHLRAGMNRANEGSVLDTSNTSRTLASPNAGTTDFMNVNLATASNAYGIRVGTGTTAVAMTDYELATIIAQGTGSGQMEHGSTTVGSLTSSSSEAAFTISRTFVNSSGAQIDVAEVGMACQSGDSGAQHRFFLIVRDVLSSVVAVGNAQTLTVTYTMKIIT